MILTDDVFPIPGGPLNSAALAFNLGALFHAARGLKPPYFGISFLMPRMWMSSQPFSQSKSMLMLPWLPTRSEMVLGAYKSVNIYFVSGASNVGESPGTEALLP